MPDPRRTVYMPLEEILPANRNPKLHADLDPSFDEFEFMDQPILDERTGQLVGGHGRLEGLAARKEKGKAAPEGIRVKGEQWFVPVQRGWSSRDDDHAERAGVALNRYTELGGWNDRLLAEILSGGESEEEQSARLASVGFSDDAFAKLMASVTDPTAPPAFPNAEVLAGNTQHSCPKCGYEWSGSPTPGRAPTAPAPAPS